MNKTGLTLAQLSPHLFLHICQITYSLIFIYDFFSTICSILSHLVQWYMTCLPCKKEIYSFQLNFPTFQFGEMTGKLKEVVADRTKMVSNTVNMIRISLNKK